LGHLVTGNIPFFVPRLSEYNRFFKARYLSINGIPAPQRWEDTALFTDGTKMMINHDVPNNYSGYKKYMITDCHVPLAGRHCDHTAQNQSQISQRMVAAQLRQNHI
jgi:hypothetical protein